MSFYLFSQKKSFSIMFPAPLPGFDRHIVEWIDEWDFLCYE